MLAGAREREARQEQAYDLFRGIFGGFGQKKTRPGLRAPKSKLTEKLPSGPGFKPNRKFITPDEFRNLPDQGFVDPQSVRTSQDNFSRFFKKKYVEGKGEIQQTVEQLAAEVKAGTEKDVPPIRLVQWKGYVYSPDHRRLVAYRRAGKDIPYVKVPYERLDRSAKARIREAEKFNDNGAYIINRTENMME